jgi:hypothetical protein
MRPTSQRTARSWQREGIKVSALSYPEYAVAGEFGTSDPDGYCLLVGQGD